MTSLFKVSLGILLFFLVVSHVQAVILESQPDFSVSVNDACNRTGSGCNEFVGGKWHTENITGTSSAWTEVTSTSTLHLTIYAGIDPVYKEYVNGIDVRVENLSRSCRFRTYHGTGLDQFDNLVNSSKEDPVLLSNIPIYWDTGAACGSWQPTDQFELRFGGGNWNGNFGTRSDGTGAKGVNAFYILSTEPEPAYVTNEITSTTTWNSTTTPYVISGDLEISSGITLTIEPGVVVKFDTSTTSSLTVNGTLVAEGTAGTEYAIGQIYFTSLKDDAAPPDGDTNGDTSSTTPAAGDWGGIIVNSGGEANFEYVSVRYAGDGSDSNIKNNGGIIYISSSTIAYSENYAIRNTAGTTTVLASDIGFADYGLYLSGGALSVTASSTIHDNDLYGIYNSTANEIDATNNWWATSTGPYHATSNTGGGGDEVSDNVDFWDWIGTRNYVFYECTYASSTRCGSVLKDLRVLRWQWSTSTTPTYASELTDAVTLWDDLGKVNIVEATSTVDVELFAISASDKVWSGSWGNDSIKLNTYYLDQDTSAQIQHTITHEFGHALGIDHSYTGNIMYSNQTSQTTEGVQDLLDYYYLWD